MTDRASYLDPAIVPITIRAGSRAYPPRLLELADPPLLLHASGPLPEAERWVGIVGARRASERGRALAARFAQCLAELGVGVVSGGAIGIDAAAHRGALKGGGPTIVVLPAPVHRPLPRQNWPLFRDVMDRGSALISELASSPDVKSAFRTRNRIIAALADAVLLIEAMPKSGTRHTLDAAGRLGRPIAAVRWPDGDPRSAAAERMFARSATAIETTADLFAWLSLAKPQVAEADPVLQALGDEELSIDRLAARAAIPLPRLLAHLTRLELEGRVQVLAGSRVRKGTPGVR